LYGVDFDVFSKLSKFTLARAVLTHDVPVYVQFYVTARCNLTCQQCNIIYANSDVRECTLDEIKQIADNFATLKVAIILLTGGEPFARQDLPEIIQAFTERGIHVRMQTNGHASQEQIQKAIEYGGNDISISLDSLRPDAQDHINGGFGKSWHEALRTIATCTKYLSKTGSFAALGCVLQRANLRDIPEVIRFGSEIGWFISLVPIHVTTHSTPMNFRTFDQSLRFTPEEYEAVATLLATVRQMRRAGALLYDSDRYLDDIQRFIIGEPTTWRAKNGGVCDSPNLYFAVLPNGDFAPCCDHRLSAGVQTFAPDFPKTFRDRTFRRTVHGVTSACAGCMYGSYPEITISTRFFAAKVQRVQQFFTSPPPKPWPVSYEALLSLAENIRRDEAVRA